MRLSLSALRKWFICLATLGMIQYVWIFTIQWLLLQKPFGTWFSPLEWFWCLALIATNLGYYYTGGKLKTLLAEKPCLVLWLVLASGALVLHHFFACPSWNRIDGNRRYLPWFYVTSLGGAGPDPGHYGRLRSIFLRVAAVLQRKAAVAGNGRRDWQCGYVRCPGRPIQSFMTKQ